MKKEYLDYLYAQKHEVMGIMDKLKEKQKLDRPQCCEDMSSRWEPTIKLEVHSVQLRMINEAIERYLILN